MNKDLKTFKCEEEAINLCGKIQNFGYLIVFNLLGECIAISENCTAWLDLDIASALNKKLDYYISYLNTEKGLQIEENDLFVLEDNILSFKISLNEDNYQLSIYFHNNQLFLEFEKNENMLIELSQLNDFQMIFEKSENTWQSLCDNIGKIIDFDRIMVYQFLEDSSGIVIAERMKNKGESLLGYRYPEFDIPIQARQLYLKNVSRQTPDIHAKAIDLHGLPHTEIDLSKSQIRALSPIHLQYLSNFGVSASASFSIIIDNKLWGLVACQNLTPKYIPHDKRSLCVFITHYAANKYLVQRQRLKIRQNETIKEIELELKEKLFYNQSFEKTLGEFAHQFLHTLSSSGLIIKTPDYTLRYGDTPSDPIFKIIHNEINNQAQKENIFTTHALTINEDYNLSNWKGLARICLDEDYDYTIYWFRKEIYIEEKWAGVPEKYQTFSEEKNAYIFSPRTSFQEWKKEVSGQSEKWSKFDIEFLSRIHKLIQDSMLRRMTEIKRLNEKLIEANNQLETYTQELGHDLKNPLSTIKTCAQFMQTRADLPADMVVKFAKNINEAAKLINDIIDRTLNSAKSSSSLFLFEIVHTEGFINQLINQATETYNLKNIELQLGELHPVYGEKTLLYQLFMNLINNAIKFSSKRETPILEIYSEIQKNRVTYFIKDNGIGIDESEKKHVFSIFRRLSNASEYEGTGIGMSIVKRIVDRLNAEISFESTLGTGTTFKISFPNE